MEKLRCKACGYITDAGKLGDFCPACGLPRSVFEPFKENLSRRRRIILELNLHPIFVHFPQAFTAAIPPFILLGVGFPPVIGNDLLTAARVMAVLLPLAVLPALAFGALDGWNRFKKLTTPALVKKIIIASVLLVLSAAASLTAIKYGTDYPGRLILLLLSLACLGCQFMLGQVGKTLMNAKLQG
jgi:rubredoxin